MKIGVNIGAWLAVGLAMLMQPTPLAASTGAEEAAALRILKRSGAERAWHYLRAREAQRAGEPAFDRMLATVAAASGRWSDATVALERVVATDNRADDRLDIIAAYLKMGDLRSAEVHLQRHKAQGADSDTMERLRDRLLNLETHYRDQAFLMRRRFDRTLGLTVGMDDNYLSSSDSDNFLGIDLQGSQRARESAYFRYAGSMRLAQGFGEATEVFGRVSGEYQQVLDNGDYNRQSGHVQLGVSHRWGSLRGQVTVSYGGMRLDEGFRTSRLGIGLGLSAVDTKRRTWRLRVNASDHAFGDDQAILDHDALSLRAGVRLPALLGGRLRPSADLLWGDTQPRQAAGARYGRQHRGARLGVHVTLPRHWSLRLSGSHRRHRYDGMFFGSSRQNSTTRWALAANWRHVRAHIWNAGVFLRHVSRDSTIDLFDHARLQAGMQASISWR